MLDVSPSSTGNRFRARRVAALKSITDDIIAAKGACTIIDLGGTANFWTVWRDHFDWPRIHVTCVNLEPQINADAPDNISFSQGDATHMPHFADGQFDICFSNSVIEHVGDWQKMRAFAAETQRIGVSYMVQTPYFWFPVEPHARSLCLHWLPESWAYRRLMRRRHGYWPKAETVIDAVTQFQSARMLDYRQFAALFDDAQISRERFLGLTKSLIAIRHDKAARRV